MHSVFSICDDVIVWQQIFLLYPDTPMNVSTEGFVVTCDRPPLTVSPDQTQTALSSFCVQELEGLAST